MEVAGEVAADLVVEVAVALEVEVEQEEVFKKGGLIK
jgi:hypothetical protein